MESFIAINKKNALYGVFLRFLDQLLLDRKFRANEVTMCCPTKNELA
jgi:hypothetical protein